MPLKEPLKEPRNSREPGRGGGFDGVRVAVRQFHPGYDVHAVPAADGNHFHKGTIPMAIPIEPYDDGVFYGAREIGGMGQGHGG